MNHRPTELNHFKDANADGVQQAGEHTVAKFVYTYDAAGNRTSAIETFDHDADGTADHTQKFTWVYDGLNRLRVETFDKDNDATGDAEDYVTRYTFDNTSNRTLMEKDTGNYDNAAFSADEKIAYTYDENDRLETETKRDGSDVLLTFTEYDYNGTTQTEKAVYDSDDPVVANRTLLSKTVNTYNEMGRLEKVEIDTDGSGGAFDETIVYGYDASGLRVSTTTNGVTTLHLFDKSNHTGYAQVIQEGVDTDADGFLDADEIDKTFMLGHDVLAQVAAGELLTLLYDIHGSTRALIDTLSQTKDDTAGGNGIQAFTYDAYGNMLATGFGVATEANALTSLLYSGEFTNAVTGQQYLRARFYSAANGRFNRLDPFAGNTSDPLSLHKYLYTHGNPVTWIDPSGEFVSIVEFLVVNGVRAINFAKKAYPALRIGFALWDIWTIGRIIHKGLTQGPSAITAWDYTELALATTGLFLGPISKGVGRIVLRPILKLPLGPALRTADGAIDAVKRFLPVYEVPIKYADDGTATVGGFFAKDGVPFIQYSRYSDELSTAHTVIHEYVHYLHWVLRGKPYAANWDEFVDVGKALDGPGGLFDQIADILLDISK